MGLETATFINGLDATNPTSGDLKSQGDDHLRLIKSTLKATFPNVTGAVTVTQTDLNTVTAKSTRAGDTYTGAHDFTSAVVNVPTQTATDNTTKVASTAYVQAAILNSAGVSATFPAQTGNKTKRLTTNGATVSWEYSGIRVPSISGETMTDAGSWYALSANASYTLPDLTGSGAFGLVFPTNATAVPASVTTSDGWSITTGASAGTFRAISPINTSTAHGVWLGQTMTPPTLATITGSTVLSVIGTAQLDTNLAVVLFRDPNGSTGNVYAVAVNTSTNAVGAVATIGSWSTAANAANAVIFADGTSSFVCGYTQGTGGGRYRVTAASVNTSTLAITVGTGVATNAANVTVYPPIKLTNGVYAVSHGATSDLVVFTVSGTTITVGTPVASGSVANGAFIARVSNTDFLAVYAATGGGTNGTRALVARTFTVSGTVPSPNAAATGSNIYADDIRLVKAFVEGSTYLVCCKDGTTSTTGNYHAVTVSGTTTTLGAISAQTNNLPTQYLDITYILPPAEAVIRFNTTTMLLGHLAGGPFAITVSGTTLTVGASGGPASTTTFLRDTATQSNYYAVGATTFDKLSVSGATVTSSFQVAATPAIIQSDTVTDKAVNYGGVWYAWTLPTMQVAVQNSKWIYRSGNNLLISGPIS